MSFQDQKTKDRKIPTTSAMRRHLLLESLFENLIDAKLVIKEVTPAKSSSASGGGETASFVLIMGTMFRLMSSDTVLAK